jgi:hypothetical protein
VGQELIIEGSEGNRRHGRKQKAREEAEGTGGKEGGSGKDTKDQEDSFSFLRTAPLADVCKIRQRADSRKLNHLRSIPVMLKNGL